LDRFRCLLRWVESLGVPFALCRKSGGPVAFDSRSGAFFFTLVLLGLLMSPPAYRMLSGGRS